MRPSRPLLRVLILAALAAAAAPVPAGAATYSSVVHVRPGHVAWIYRHPDAASARVGYLKAGALRVRTMECRTLAAGGWCHVMHNGTRGWVQDRFLRAAAVMRG